MASFRSAFYISDSRAPRHLARLARWTGSSTKWLKSCLDRFLCSMRRATRTSTCFLQSEENGRAGYTAGSFKKRLFIFDEVACVIFSTTWRWRTRRVWWFASAPTPRHLPCNYLSTNLAQASVPFSTTSFPSGLRRSRKGRMHSGCSYPTGSRRLRVLLNID